MTTPRTAAGRHATLCWEELTRGFGHFPDCTVYAESGVRDCDCTPEKWAAAIVAIEDEAAANAILLDPDLAIGAQATIATLTAERASLAILYRSHIAYCHGFMGHQGDLVACDEYPCREAVRGIRLEQDR